MMETNITETEIDQELKEIEREKLEDEINHYKELRNQMIGLKLRLDIINDVELEEIITIIKKGNQHILERKKEIEDIPKRLD